ncbi:MAG: ribose-phosphate diphosphokinase [Gammaproteobacteria bacterium]
MIVLTFPDYHRQGSRFAERLNARASTIHLHHFPDGESLVRLPTDLPEHAVIFRSLDRPNDKLIELMLAATTARQLGAKRISLVAPYLCYMRQDIANQPGEAVSQRIVGRLLADLFDDVLTVDPHLHRISALDEAIPLKNAVALSAGGEIACFLKNRLDDAVLLGPDEESEQWVAGIARQTGFDFAIAHKIRNDDKSVDVTLPAMDFRRRTVVVVDDMASTGRTLANTAELLLNSGAGEVYAAITHPLFFGDAERQLLKAGIKSVWSTDSIDHATSVIALDALLARALKEIL